MEVQIKKIDNGYVVQVSKWDVLSRQPDVSVFAYATIDEALAKIKELA
jgi:hypothetical protein